MMQISDTIEPTSELWNTMADQALAGQPITPEQGLSLLRADDSQLLEILAAAYRVRHHWHGKRVHLNFLLNAKSGRCGEDCGYCSQSKVSTAPIEEYNLLEPDKILDGAELASQRKAKTYCVVTSGRGPIETDLAIITDTVPKIKARYGLAVCVSPGLLSPEQAQRLKAAGVDRINHNLNTSARFYPRICSTHTYEQRMETLRAVRAADLEICSGGIVGMGEEDVDVVELALTLGEFRVEALPINFLIPVQGTPLAGISRLNPRYCLKVLALFRLANPKCELRMAAGREIHLGSLQAMGLYAANSMFVGDYLTCAGQAPSEDYQMIEALGFEAVVDGAPMSPTP